MILKGDCMAINKWEGPHRIELEFQRALFRFLMRVFNIPFDEGSSYIWNWNDALNQLAYTMAEKMVTQTLHSTAKSWREAAANSSNGRRIYEMLHNELQWPTGFKVLELIEQNAQLIRSLPQDMAQEINKKIFDATMSGNRPEAILKELLPDMAHNKAQLIARTESAKAQTALIQVRAENLGLNHYVWRTATDQRVRSSHKHMQGIICSFDDPPAPEQLIGIKSTLGHYPPGGCPNCRCFPEIIVDIDDIGWPHECYVNGNVRTLGKRQFERISG